MLKGRLAGLDGLRGILALCVAYSHAFGHLLGWNNAYTPIGNGSYAVDVFFIMSGVVLYHAYKNRFEMSEKPVIQFMLARFFRLWPLHLFTILLVLVIFVTTKGVLLPGWIKLNTLIGFSLDISMLSSVGLFGDHGVVNQPSWSISVEMWIGSLIMLILFKEWRSSFLLILISSLIFIFGTVNPTGGASPIDFILSSGAWRCILGMSLGVVAYKLAVSFYANASKHLMNITASVAILIVFAVILGCKPTGVGYIATTAIVGLLLTSIPLSDGWSMRLLESSPIRRLGELSFSLYLIHTPVIYLMLAFKSSNQTFNIALTHTAIVLSIIAAKYCNWLIENKFAYQWKFKAQPIKNSDSLKN